MRVFDATWLMEGVARQMWHKAETSRRYTGIPNSQSAHLLHSLTAQHVLTGSLLILSFDEGMHSSGWWKNPDYERCWHLSLSFRDPIAWEPISKNVKATDLWLEAFYGQNRRFVWSESPYSPAGKSNDVWHYRVFCDPAWQPILPRKEVYSREFTEAGWLSFSDLQDEHSKALARLQPLPGEQ